MYTSEGRQEMNMTDAEVLERNPVIGRTIPASELAPKKRIKKQIKKFNLDGDLRSCPNCKSTEIEDNYIYMQCMNCLMTGPQMNGGNNDDHADHIDHKRAIEAWNNLPRTNTCIM